MKTSPVLSTLICVLVLAALSFPVSAQAQRREADGDMEAMGTRSALAAGALEWLLPTGGGLVFGVSLWADATDDDDYCGTACAVAGAAYVVGTVWAIVDAVNTAHDRNDRVARGRTASGLLLMPSPDGGLSVGVRLSR